MIVAEPPDAAIIPTLTLTNESPTPLPAVIVPVEVVTEPATSVVLLSGVSVNVTDVASALPLFVMLIV